LRYQVEEITGANLRPGEDRQLERERLLLSQGRRLAELVQATYGPLYEEEPSILQSLGALTGSLKELAAIDAELVEDRDRFAEALAQLTDLASACAPTVIGWDSIPTSWKRWRTGWTFSAGSSRNTGVRSKRSSGAAGRCGRNYASWRPARRT